MPDMINTPEMRFQVDESRKFPVVEELLARSKPTGARGPHDGAA
jgi:phosphomannomutase